MVDLLVENTVYVCGLACILGLSSRKKYNSSFFQERSAPRDDAPSLFLLSWIHWNRCNWYSPSAKGSYPTHSKTTGDCQGRVLDFQLFLGEWVGVLNIFFSCSVFLSRAADSQFTHRTVISSVHQISGKEKN